MRFTNLTAATGLALALGGAMIASQATAQVPESFAPEDNEWHNDYVHGDPPPTEGLGVPVPGQILPPAVLAGTPPAVGTSTAEKLFNNIHNSGGYAWAYYGTWAKETPSYATQGPTTVDMEFVGDVNMVGLYYRNWRATGYRPTEFHIFVSDTADFTGSPDYVFDETDLPAAQDARLTLDPPITQRFVRLVVADDMVPAGSTVVSTVRMSNLIFFGTQLAIPSTLEAGNVLAGDPIVYTITNNTDEALTIDGIDTSEMPSGFSLVTPDSFPVNIAARSSYDAELVASPLSVGNFSFDFTVNYTFESASDSQVVAASGNVTAFAPGFIPVQSVVASGNEGAFNAPENLINHSQITEGSSLIGSRNALHSQQSNVGFWRSANSTNLVDDYIIFEFGENTQIGDMVVWNLANAVSNAVGRAALKEGIIEKQLEGETEWTLVGNHTFTWTAREPDLFPFPATDVVALDTEAASIRIRPAGGPDVGNYFRQEDVDNNVAAINSFGLAEVRFYSPGVPYLEYPHDVLDLGTHITPFDSYSTDTVVTAREGSITIDEITANLDDLFSIDHDALPITLNADEALTLQVSIGRAGRPEAGNYSGNVVLTGTDEFDDIVAVSIPFSVVIGAYEPNYLPGVSAFSESVRAEAYEFYDASNLVSYVGMTEVPAGHLGSRGAQLYNGTPVFHYFTMWSANEEEPGPPFVIDFDLGAVQNVGELLVWNFNRGGALTDIGASGITIQTAVNEGSFSPFQSGNTFAIPQASGASDYEAGLSVNLGGIEARYVRLTTTGNHGRAAEWTGLSTVRFYTTNYFNAPSEVNITPVSLNGSGLGTITITNDSTVTPLVINDAYFTDGGETFIIVDTDFPIVIAPGESATITVQIVENGDKDSHDEEEGATGTLLVEYEGANNNTAVITVNEVPLETSVDRSWMMYE